MRISTARNPADRARRGFTLVEFMMAVLLSGIVMTGILTTNLSLMRSGVRVTQYAEMSSQVRRGLEQFEGDVKTAITITWNNASDITLTLPNQAGTTSQVTYAWTSATQSFFSVPGALSSVTVGRVYLVNGIPLRSDGSAGLIFARYDRDGNAATTDLATKKVQVSMNAVRSAWPAAITVKMANTTDTTVSAIFILRNKP
jgi:prepilin-type N-terminal cleavage/methylation domain-containing protein